MKKPDARPPDPLACGMPNCARPALIRRRLSHHNWIVICDHHDVALTQKAADDWMREAGLDRQPGETPPAWTARTRAWLHAHRRPQPAGLRHAADYLARPARAAPPPEPPPAPKPAPDGWQELPL